MERDACDEDLRKRRERTAEYCRGVLVQQALPPVTKGHLGDDDPSTPRRSGEPRPRDRFERSHRRASPRVGRMVRGTRDNVRAPCATGRRSWSSPAARVRSTSGAASSTSSCGGSASASPGSRSARLSDRPVRGGGGRRHARRDHRLEHAVYRQLARLSEAHRLPDTTDRARRGADADPPPGAPLFLVRRPDRHHSLWYPP
jgi:hypothetical protein